MKKKKKASTQGSAVKTNQMTLDIDYEKLAEAMIKAERKIECEKAGKRQKGVRWQVYRFLNGLVYIFPCIISFYAIYITWKNRVVGENSLFSSIAATVIFAVIGIVMFLCQQESLNDSKEEAIDYFDSNVAILALIVALMALVKGI